MKIIFILLGALLNSVIAIQVIGKCKGIIDVNVNNQCVLDEGGIANCFASWNDDAYSVHANAPKDVAFSQIVFQQGNMCGIVAEDQSLKCWGIGEWNSQWGTGILEPKAGKYIYVCIQLFYACAVQEDGNLYCWGKHRSNLHSNYPKDGSYKAVGCGYNAACAVRNDGEVVCWGTTSDQNYRQVIDKNNFPEGVKVDAISIQSHHALGLKPDGTLMAWGRDTYGSWGNMPEGKVDSAVATGFGGVAILSEDKTLVCWGWDLFNFLEDCPKGEFYALGCYDSYCCAIKTDKEIVCWGRIGHGDNEYTKELIESGIKAMDCEGDVCGSEKATIMKLEAEVALWKARFQEVQSLEVNDRHSVQAMAKYPDPDSDTNERRRLQETYGTYSSRSSSSKSTENKVGNNLVPADSFATKVKKF